MLDHLGSETQRQWSDKAIARTTRCLLGLFSVVTLLATRLGHHARLRVSVATLAAVRRQIWCDQGLLTSRLSPEPRELPAALREAIAYALCHAA